MGIYPGVRMGNDSLVYLLFIKWVLWVIFADFD